MRLRRHKRQALNVPRGIVPYTMPGGEGNNALVPAFVVTEQLLGVIDDTAFGDSGSLFVSKQMGTKNNIRPIGVKSIGTQLHMMTKILQGVKHKEYDLIKCSDVHIACRLDSNNAKRSHDQRSK
jgi:hypothetical protein